MRETISVLCYVSHGAFLSRSCVHYAAKRSTVHLNILIINGFSKLMLRGICAEILYEGISFRSALRPVPYKARPKAPMGRSVEHAAKTGCKTIAIMTKKSVAICFFGLPRALEHPAPSIAEHLIAPLKAKSEAVCLAHLYRSSIDPAQNSSALLPLENCLTDTPEDVFARWPMGDILSCGDYWYNNGASLRNLVLQLHSLHEVTELAVRSGAEHCFFVRPDLLCHDSLTAQ